jgi:hypothetical protein
MAAQLPTNASITGTKSYFDWVQNVSEGIFFPSFLFGLFVIMFMSFKAGTSNGKAFVGSSFICMIIGILLTTLGWMAKEYMYATIILTAIGAVWSYLDDSFE